MSIISKIKRVVNALSTETDPDYILSGRAILRGMLNFKKGELEPTSKDFAYICKECPDNIDETDPDLIEQDDDFPFLSGRMCGACGGCVLAFKVRQNIKPCEKWQPAQPIKS